MPPKICHQPAVEELSVFTDDEVASDDNGSDDDLALIPMSSKLIQTGLLGAQYFVLVCMGLILYIQISTFCIIMITFIN